MEAVSQSIGASALDVSAASALSARLRSPAKPVQPDLREFPHDPPAFSADAARSDGVTWGDRVAACVPILGHIAQSRSAGKQVGWTTATCQPPIRGQLAAEAIVQVLEWEPGGQGALAFLGLPEPGMRAPMRCAQRATDTPAPMIATRIRTPLFIALRERRDPGQRAEDRGRPWRESGAPRQRDRQSRRGRPRGPRAVLRQTLGR